MSQDGEARGAVILGRHGMGPGRLVEVEWPYGEPDWSALPEEGVLMFTVRRVDGVLQGSWFRPLGRAPMEDSAAVEPHGKRPREGDTKGG